jgi:hypothetical protein
VSCDQRAMDALDAGTIRRINVVECLQEEYPDVPEPPESAPHEWTEAQIRAYFESGGELPDETHRTEGTRHSMEDEAVLAWMHTQAELQHDMFLLGDAGPRSRRLVCLPSQKNHIDKNRSNPSTGDAWSVLEQVPMRGIVHGLHPPLAQPG